MTTALIIIYALGLIFTWAIDFTIVGTKIRLKGWRHVATMAIIWICSPLLILSLLVLTIKFFIDKYRKR